MNGKGNMELILVTGNAEKLAIAEKALQNSSFKIVAKKIDCEEVQSDDVAEIAAKSAMFASRILGVNVIKIDSGLFIKALDGFPGPYSSFIERRLKPIQILKMMRGENNRRAFYREVLAYCEFGKEPIVFTTFTHGHIARRASGKFGWNFDRIFIANGDENTMAHFEDSERISRYSDKNWKRLTRFLSGA